MTVVAPLTISLLGPFRVAQDGVPLSDFKYNKARALLAYLAMEREVLHPRAELCALFWPELPDRAARRNLTQVVLALREALDNGTRASGPLIATPEAVHLDTERAIDVDALNCTTWLDEADRHAHRSWRTCAACEDRLRAAVTLYRGEFLSQFFVADSAPFEEWALLWRERLRQRVMTALERLVQRAEWCGRTSQAVIDARRLCDLDPLREDSQRQLIRLLALDGQTAAAAAQVEAMRRLLADELGVEPDDETRALAEKVRLGQLGEEALRIAPEVFGPAAPNALIGRDHEVDALCAQLRDGSVRALTLTGAPGIGKSRLALHVGQALRFDFEDGVQVVELAPLADAGLVASTVARALGIPEKPGQSLSTTLGRWLRSRHLLLVLDNFEHVLDAAPLVAEWLAAGPGLTALITSRAPLRLRAERQVNVAPLSHEAAMRLFGERAGAVQPGFALTAENAVAVAALCDQVDRLPLSIELIAGRARTFSPNELLVLLEQPLEALAKGARDLPQRHRTLRDAIRWTYDRIGPDEQQAFVALAVFIGGATSAAVEAVLRLGPARPALESLAEAGLVQVESASGETRFTTLVTLREFGLEQLESKGERSAAQQLHAAWFTALAERTRPELDGPDQLAWFDRLEREHANLRAALDWCAAHDVLLGLRLACSLLRFWSIRGHLNEGRRELQRLLAQAPSEPSALTGDAFVAASRLAYIQGAFEAALAQAQAGHALFLELEHSAGIAGARLALGRAYFGLGRYAEARASSADSLALAEQDGDQAGTAEALVTLSHIAQRQGDYVSARTLAERALDLFRRLDDPRSAAGVSLNLGVAAYEQADYDTALRLTEASLKVFRRLHDPNGVNTALINLGNTWLDTGHLLDARACFEEAIALDRKMDSINVSIPLGGLGRVLRRMGDFSGARACFAESLHLRVQAGDRRGIAVTLTNFVHLAHAEHQPDRATRLLGASEALRREIGAPLHPGRRKDYDQMVQDLRATLGAEAFDLIYAAGTTMLLDQAMALALALP